MIKGLHPMLLQIIDIMKEREITYRKLSRISGVHTGTISSVLSGHRSPSLNTLTCLTDALNLQISVREKNDPS